MQIDIYILKIVFTAPIIEKGNMANGNANLLERKKT